jgi:hypothetical protein
MEEILFINADYPKKELLSWAMKQNGISKDLEKIIDNRLSVPRLEKFRRQKV